MKFLVEIPPDLLTELEIIKRTLGDVPIQRQVENSVMDWIIRFWSHQRDMRLKEESTYDIDSGSREYQLGDGYFDVCGYERGIGVAENTMSRKFYEKKVGQIYTEWKFGHEKRTGK